MVFVLKDMRCMFKLWGLFMYVCMHLCVWKDVKNVWYAGHNSFELLSLWQKVGFAVFLDFDIFLEFIFFLFIFLNLVGFDVKPWHLRWCLSWVPSWRMEDLISFCLFLWNLELEIWWWLAVFEIQNPLKSIYNSWGKHCSLDERLVLFVCFSFLFNEIILFS